MRGQKINGRGTEEFRFWSKVRISDVNTFDGTPCWEWIAANCKGYGRFGLVSTGYYQKVKVVVAHVWAYEYCIGPKPDGCELDHLCRNVACVNPWHLEAVAPIVNNYRSRSVGSVNAGKINCIHGHPLKGSNLIIERDGSRKCRTCENAGQRRRYYARRRRQSTKE